MGTKIDREKFTGQNDFNMWKIKMEALLITQGLGNAIEPDFKKEGLGGSSSTTSEQAAEIDKKARSTIILSLGDSVIREVAKERTVAGLWTKLKNLYMTKSLSNRLYIKRKMFSLRMMEGSSLDEHIDEFNKVCDALETIDEGLNDESKALVLISSLPKSYEHFVDALLYGRQTLSLEEVKSALGTKKLKDKQEKADSEAGHFKRDCPERKSKIKDSKDKVGNAAIATDESSYETAEVLIASKEKIQVGIGTVSLKMFDGVVREITQVRHVPDLKRNLIYVGMLDQMGCIVKAEKCVLRVIKGSMVIMKGNKNNDLYILNGQIVIGEASVTESGKASRIKFESAVHTTKEKLGYIHSDLWGPAQVKVLRTDNGLEYCNKLFEDYCEKNGSESTESGSNTYQLARDRKMRTIRPPKRYAVVDLITYTLSAAHEINDNEPKTYQEAITSKNSLEWKRAMDEEVESLMKNETWKLIKKPEKKKAISCKWIYKIKEGIPGAEPRRFKARLVARGFTQREGVDFTEVFSPVVRHASIRVILALMAVQDMHLEQMDVKTAFLHGELQEEIIMDQPEGYEVPSKRDFVCLLKKSLYGLKQSPRQWYLRFDSFMLKHSYNRCNYDCCVYYKEISERRKIYLLLYVDDMLIACHDMAEIDQLKRLLSSEFEIKDIGPAKKILGVEIIRNRKAGTMFLTQKDYIEKMLVRFATEALKEAIWLKGMVTELGAEQDSVEVYCDSQSAIHLSKNQTHHEKTKHIDVKLHFVRLEVSRGAVKLLKINTEENPADMLTKAVHSAKFNICMNLAGICRN
ncbi:reverse transcriptase Ty1/copia-type domain-containing protein [Citrus sinensis]|uniref:Reverse transcriptase Ty1/copia-type domain-containing protein n=1 Tax=Citrus sinensis TaxID=2711 RepID=A0ACB8HWZ6_CITSI|nr:reverse transcriptase Ty1/copia-type domain-containing protein [Citrus sinensis]